MRIRNNKVNVFLSDDEKFILKMIKTMPPKHCLYEY